MTRVLMTQGDPMADTATKHLILPYNIDLEFCRATGVETLRQLQQEHYDAVVLRQGMPDLTLTAVKKQYELQCHTAAPHLLLPQPETLFFALFSQTDSVHPQNLQKAGFVGILCQPLSEYKLATTILDRTGEALLQYRSREESLRLQIQELLLTLGCPTHLKGFYYLEECLVFLAKEPGALYMATKVLYPRVAEHMNTSATNLERSMRTVLEHLWERGNVQKLAEYFPCRGGKICVTQFLATLSQCLQLQQHHA